MLFELATDGPGFAVDEDRAHLGETLVLPPWLEPSRSRIESVHTSAQTRGLRPVDGASAPGPLAPYSDAICACPDVRRAI